MDIAIVGAGTVGTAVGVAWVRAGHRVIAVSGRDETRGASQHVVPRRARGPDRRSRSRRLARCGRRAGSGVGDDRPDGGDLDRPRHTRVALLRRPRAGGARSGRSPPVAAHWRCIPCRPSPTWPEPSTALAGCAVAITADDEEGFLAGEELGRDLGGEPFRLRRRAAPAVPRGRGVRVELSRRDLGCGGGVVLARGCARRAGGDAPAAAGDARQRAPARASGRADRARRTRRRGDGRAEPRRDRRRVAGAGRSVCRAVPHRAARGGRPRAARGSGRASKRCWRDGADARRGEPAIAASDAWRGRGAHGRARADDGRAARGARLVDRTRPRRDRPRRGVDLREPAAVRGRPRTSPGIRATRSAMSRSATALGVDVVWAPPVDEMYPLGASLPHRSPGRSAICTRARRGRVTSPASCRWCTGSSPSSARATAYFGEKDAQQLFLVRRMGRRSRSLGMRIVGGSDGARVRRPRAVVAQRLSLGRRSALQAACLFLALTEAAERARAGERDAHVLVAVMAREIGATPLARLDYAAVVNDATFEPIGRDRRARAGDRGGAVPERPADRQPPAAGGPKRERRAAGPRRGRGRDHARRPDDPARRRRRRGRARPRDLASAAGRAPGLFVAKELFGRVGARTRPLVAEGATVEAASRWPRSVGRWRRSARAAPLALTWLHRLSAVASGATTPSRGTPSRTGPRGCRRRARWATMDRRSGWRSRGSHVARRRRRQHRDRAGRLRRRRAAAHLAFVHPSRAHLRRARVAACRGSSRSAG